MRFRYGTCLNRQTDSSTLARPLQSSQHLPPPNTSPAPTHFRATGYSDDAKYEYVLLKPSTRAARIQAPNSDFRYRLRFLAPSHLLTFRSTIRINIVNSSLLMHAGPSTAVMQKSMENTSKRNIDLISIASQKDIFCQ